jgi:hypothetical protein
MQVTLSSSLSDRDAEDYDRFVAEARGGHYSQTRAWSAMSTAGRPLAAQYFLARDGAAVVGAGVLLRPRIGPLLGPAAHMERGPVCDDPGRVAEVSRELAHATRLRGVARLAIMPYWAGDEAVAVERSLVEERFASVQAFDGAHVNTLRLAIGGLDEKEILSGGERHVLRRNLKHAEKHGATARLGTMEDVPTLVRLYRELMEGQDISMKPGAFFDRLAERLTPRGPAAIFLCDHEGDTVSAVLIVKNGKLATFIIGASDRSARKITKMVLPLKSAILWARDEGCDAFDFGGVPMDGDTDEKRKNIAAFKFQYGAAPVHLVGEHARWL